MNTIVSSFWLMVILVCMLVGTFFGGFLVGKYWGKEDPVEPKIQYIDRPATQEEVEEGKEATPKTIKIFKTDTLLVNVCIDAPDYLVPSDTLNQDSTRKSRVGFSLLPIKGGVTKGNNTLTVRYFDPVGRSWTFNTYDAAPTKSWWLGPYLSIRPRSPEVGLTVLRQDGNRLYGLGGGLDFKGRPSVTGSYLIRF